MKVFIYIRKVLFLFLCGALSFYFIRFRKSGE